MLSFESAVDDLANPVLLLPPSELIKNVPSVLDLGFAALEAVTSDLLFAPLSKNRAQIPVADFPYSEVAQKPDGDLELLCTDKRGKYLVADTSFQRLDTDLRTALRPLSMAHTFVQALNAVITARKMDPQVLRSCGDTIGRCIGQVVDAIARVLGAVTRIRRAGFIAGTSWDFQHQLKAMRTPWNHRLLFAGQLRQINSASCSAEIAFVRPQLVSVSRPVCFEDSHRRVSRSYCRSAAFDLCAGARCQMYIDDVHTFFCSIWRVVCCCNSWMSLTNFSCVSAGW